MNFKSCYSAVTKIIFLVFVVFAFSGCFDGLITFVTDKAKDKRQEKKQLKQRCESSEEESKKKLENGDFSLKNSSIHYDEAKCPYFIYKKTISTETKSFAVNGEGKDDFKVKVTKNVIVAQKIQKGKILEDNIEITFYKIEEQEKVIFYNARKYLANSSFIKNEKQRLKNQYQTARNRLHKNLPCFSIARKNYCDGDIIAIKESGRELLAMVRAWEVNYETLKWKLFEYDGVEAKSAVERYTYYWGDLWYTAVEIGNTKIVGNDYLKGLIPPDNLDKYFEDKEFELELIHIRTFKEW